MKALAQAVQTYGLSAVSVAPLVRQPKPVKRNTLTSSNVSINMFLPFKGSVAIRAMKRHIAVPNGHGSC